MLLGRAVLILAAASALGVAGPARAAGYSVSVTIPAGPLLIALQQFERQTGVELLFDHDVVAGLQGAAVNGRLPAEAALQQLLGRTNLNVRRAASGALILERTATPTLAQQDVTVSEILVIGRHTQNADIRRLESDVQPYAVATQADILGAHRDDIDQYFMSRVPSNTQIVPPSLGQDGATRSEINLRGLGAEATLVLVDGRRIPGLPLSEAGFEQADVNAIPLHAIARIETLTGTAGGIYGFGALGGVVNVVLDRDSRGLDLFVTGGVSSRGDGQHSAIEARFGKTFADGASDFTIFASHSQTGAVLEGEHPYQARAARIYSQLQLASYLSGNPTGNSVGVFGFGSTLTFKPEFGGATLASGYTFLPIGVSKNRAQIAASLTQHAGQLDFSLPEGNASSDLGSNPRSDSLLFNARHRFGAGVEVYVDAIALRSAGQSHDRHFNGEGYLSSDSPGNPFDDFIQITFPVLNMDSWTSTRVESTRFTTGFLAPLPFGWRGTAEASRGRLRYTVKSAYTFPPNAFVFGFGDPSDPNPFGDWTTFQNIVAAGAGVSSAAASEGVRLGDQSLRLAGPVFSTGEGQATLTLLAERRTEDVPASTQIVVFFDDPTPFIYKVASRSSLTTSFSAELRSRLFGRQAPAPLLRELEVQLAVRHDDQRSDFAKAFQLEGGDERIHAKFAATAYTLGAKISPWPWLTLRGSYATGQQPPPLRALSGFEDQATGTAYVASDPKRGGQQVGEDGSFLYKGGGNPGLKAARADTMSLGLIFAPFQAGGPKLAIDYSRIRETQVDLLLLPDDVLTNEDALPGRVTRAPLTDEDRAKGYTAGRVIMLDTRDINGAGVDVDAIDARAEWPLALASGRLRLYAAGAYQMNNRTRVLFKPDIQHAGYQDGPLKWRANAGADWSSARLSLGANLQYFGSYFIFPSGLSPDVNDLKAQIQGGAKVPSQIYLDLHATWRAPTREADPSRGLTVEFGIVNVFDTAPPRESPAVVTGSPAYSRYGDPRQRRFEIVLSRHF
jgi:iron complex outermembrane receptor protein